MQTTRGFARRNRASPGVRRRSLFAIVLIVPALAGCHDGAPRILAPAAPQLDVFADGIWLVNSLADPGDGACTNAECTLREAIAAAAPGERITFKSNLDGMIALTVGRLVINKNLTIKGLGADRLTVDGQGAGLVFQIGTMSSQATVFLTDLRITRGVSNATGGGIHVTEGSALTLTRSAVVGNSAAQGGGIFSRGTLTIRESTISGNTAQEYGGGIDTDGHLTVETSTISSNAARLAGGGIMDVCQPATCTIQARLWNTTVTNNAVTVPTANGAVGGGGIATLLGITVANTIVAGNETNGSIGGPEADCLGNVHSLGYSLTTTGGGCTFITASDVVLAAPLIFTSVLELGLGNNGGPTQTHALLEHGDAVDAGHCAGETTDQRGFARPYDDPAMPNAIEGCDIGAFEWQPAGKVKGPKS